LTEERERERERATERLGERWQLAASAEWRAACVGSRQQAPGGEAGEQRLERLRERASTRAGPGVQRDCGRKKKGRRQCGAELKKKRRAVELIQLNEKVRVLTVLIFELLCFVVTLCFQLFG